MAYNPEDLDELEVVLLGVLCVGLPPARVAGSDTFRVDHVTAVVAGLAEDGDPARYLGDDGIHVTPEFVARLKTTISQLVEKELVAHQAAGMPAAAGAFEEGLALDLVDPDEHPAVLDRYLAQLCMEQLFNIPAVYPVLMERYAASGEVWRRLRDEGG
jgi:hypothetical protein